MSNHLGIDIKKPTLRRLLNKKYSTITKQIDNLKTSLAVCYCVIGLLKDH